jgi:hypothetical protein
LCSSDSPTLTDHRTIELRSNAEAHTRAEDAVDDHRVVLNKTTVEEH